MNALKKKLNRLFIYLSFTLIWVCTLLLPMAAGGADVLVTTEIQVTSSAADESTPTLGADTAPGDSSIVVYSSDDGVNPSNVFYQRLKAGALLGSPVMVGTPASEDKFNDISGNLIIYTEFIAPAAGIVTLYDISTGARERLSSPADVREAHIHTAAPATTTFSWVESAPGGANVFAIDIMNIGKELPEHLAGPIPPGAQVEIGEYLIVWEVDQGGQTDIEYHDIRDHSTHALAGTLVDEREPSTFESKVVWRETTGTGSTRIVMIDVDTLVMTLIVDDGSANLNPSIDGNIITWESNAASNFDIYLHRIDEGDTFQVTTDSFHQHSSSVFRDQVAYIDSRDGNSNVFVSMYEFVPDNSPPIADAGPDQSILLNLSATLNGSAVDPDGDPIVGWLWAVESAPAGSMPSFADRFSPSTTFVTDLEGIYILSLSASDGIAFGPPDSMTLTVNANQPPTAVANADVTTGTVPLTVNFDGSASSDPEGQPLQFRWSFRDGSAPSADMSPTHTFTNTGTFVVELAVIDPFNGLSFDTITITVGCLDVSPVTHDFGDVEIGWSASMVFTLTSVDNIFCNRDITVSAITPDDGGSPAFDITQTPTLPVTLAPGESADVEMLFAPEATGMHESTMVVESNSLGTPLITVPLSGMGFAIDSITCNIDDDGDVDRNDVRHILTLRNQPADNCPECDVDGDGVITVRDAMNCIQQCTRPRCATE